MASNNISILIQAQDQASPVLKRVGGALDDTGRSAANQGTTMQRLSDNWATFATISVGAGLALHSLTGFLGASVKAANDLQSSLIGLNSIANHFGQNADAAKEAAKSLASDGLMTVADAATGLKNLLASGFELPQAIQLMERFKDSAAFNRQASLSFGDAVRSATEGIKNGNSILVDNAGVTKNLSVILTEAGFSAQDLMRATTDASVRQALFNGIIKETNASVGDAARLTDSAAGKQAQMAAQTTILKQQIGEALQPALLSLLQIVTPLIQTIAAWVQQHHNLAAAVLIGTGVLLGLVATLGVVASAVRSTMVVVEVFGPAAVRSAGMAQTAFGSLRAMLAIPMVMPAIAIGAAIAALVAVQAKARETRDVLEQTTKSVESATNSQLIAIRQLGELKRNGTPEQKARATAALNRIQGNANGTNFATGGRTLVGELGPEVVDLPRGSVVTPAWRARGTGAQGGDTHITISGNITIETPAASMRTYASPSADGAADVSVWRTEMAPDTSGPVHVIDTDHVVARSHRVIALR